MAHCLIGLGANLGEPAAQLDQACDRLCRWPQVVGVARSGYYATAPVGGPAGQPAFLNAVLRIDTHMSPEALLAATRDVEQQLGRERRQRWGPRTIDIDLLLYDTLVMETDALVLPHPRMAVRRFVLEPAHEIAADMLHPATGWTIGQLWERLAHPPHYVAIAGADLPLRARVAEQVARETRTRWLRDPVRPLDPSARGLPAAALVAHELAALAARRQQLDTLSTARSTTPPAWSVCDYWLPQSLAVARMALEDAARHDVETACTRVLQQTPPPKCVLLLTHDTPLARDTDRAVCGDQRMAGPHAAALARELARIAALPRQSPVLRAPVSAPALAVAELAAAMDAMR